MTAYEEVILVDRHDAPLGFMEKMEAHRGAHLHRAFSVFLFDAQGRMLLQRRSEGKYHCGGLWSNAVCSHPRPDETMEISISRKMQQEIGASPEVEKAFTFYYKANLDNGLTEHELDHIFIGRCNGELQLNPAEVDAVRYAYPEEIMADMERNSSAYTPWFRLLLPKMMEYLSR